MHSYFILFAKCCLMCSGNISMTSETNSATQRRTKNLRNLRNYTVKLADVGCTKPKVDTKQHVSI